MLACTNEEVDGSARRDNVGELEVALQIRTGDHTGYRFDRMVIQDVNQAADAVTVNIEGIEGVEGHISSAVRLPSADFVYGGTLHGVRLSSGVEIAFESTPTRIEVGPDGPALRLVFDIHAPVASHPIPTDLHIRFLPGVAIHSVVPTSVCANASVRIEVEVVPPERARPFSLELEAQLGTSSARLSDITEPGIYQLTLNAEVEPGAATLVVHIVELDHSRRQLEAPIHVETCLCGDEGFSCDDATPYCLDGDCVECRGTEDCSPQSIASICSENGRCRDCRDNDDCLDVAGGFICDLSGRDRGTCECGDRRAPCPAEQPYCVEDTSTCVVCQVDAHCNPPQVCNQGMCEDREQDPSECREHTEATLDLLCAALSPNHGNVVVRLASAADWVGFGNMTLSIVEGPEGMRFAGSEPLNTLDAVGIDRASNRYFDNLDDEGQLRIFMEPENVASPAAIGAGAWAELSLVRDDGFEPGQRFTIAIDAWLTGTDWAERHVEALAIVEISR